MTLLQIKKEINKNIHDTIFSFEGFNVKKDTELKKEYIFLLRKKYGNRNLSFNDRIKKAGKHIEEFFEYCEHEKREYEPERVNVIGYKIICEYLEYLNADYKINKDNIISL